MANINPNQYGMYNNQNGAMNNVMNTGQTPMPWPSNYVQPQIAQTPSINANYNNTQGLTIAQVNDPMQVDNYPVAAGNTVILINFNQHWFAIKSTNFNGVPMPIQWCDYSERVSQTQQTNVSQTDPNAVTRQEFDELKNMLAQALNNNQNSGRGSHYNRDRRNGQNVQSNDASTDNG